MSRNWLPMPRISIQSAGRHGAIGSPGTTATSWRCKFRTGKQKRTVSEKQWLTYGVSQDGASLYGIGVTENRRLILGRVEIASAREQVAADLGLSRPAWT